jgi:hypothetical protein
MRKVILAALIVFTLALAVGLATAGNAQARTRCWYECLGDGEYLYCCRSGPAVQCKIVFSAPISCP